MCIRNNVLRDILIDQKAEVIQMVLETFDQENTRKPCIRRGYEDGYQDGRKDGYLDGKQDLLRELIQKKLEKGKSE